MQDWKMLLQCFVTQDTIMKGHTMLTDGENQYNKNAKYNATPIKCPAGCSQRKKNQLKISRNHKKTHLQMQPLERETEELSYLTSNIIKSNNKK